MSNRDNLIMCTATLDVDPMVCTADDFRDQVAATAAAGFAGISQWELQHGALTSAGFTTAEMLAVIADHDLSVEAFEALLPFSGSEQDALETARRTFANANQLGAGIVPAVSLFPDEFESLEAATQRYGVLCEVAGEHELKVPIEFLPWSAIPDLATAWRIVDASNSPSGGIMLDTWHWQRQPGGPNTELLAQIPPSFLPVVQLCDVAPDPGDDPYTEAVSARRLPGDGVVDFDEFFTALYATGADPVLATETFNTELAAAGRFQLATAVAESSRRVLEPYV